MNFEVDIKTVLIVVIGCIFISPIFLLFIRLNFLYEKLISELSLEQSKKFRDTFERHGYEFIKGYTLITPNIIVFRPFKLIKFLRHLKEETGLNHKLIETINYLIYNLKFAVLWMAVITLAILGPLIFLTIKLIS